MSTLITQGRGVANPAGFTAQYKHKYFCDIVQGNTSNDTRLENSLAVNAGTWAPTGSIVYADNATAKPGVGSASATNIQVPQIVTVGSEHDNVTSEFGNSGCGLITAIPLNADNLIMTTVYKVDDTYAKGDLLTAKEIDFDGKKVVGIAKAAEGETVIGIGHTAPAMTQYEVTGILFDAYFKPAIA